MAGWILLEVRSGAVRVCVGAVVGGQSLGRERCVGGGLGETMALSGGQVRNVREEKFTRAHDSAVLRSA